MADKTGLVAVLDECEPGAAALPEADPDVQEDMFRAAMPMPVKPTLQPNGRGPGRPPGAKNRSTEEWREYLLSRYQSPLIGLLEIASRSPVELAKELGLYRRVKVGENGELETKVLDIHAAFAHQRAAMEAALPYLHQKQPLAIQGDGVTPIPVVLNLGLGTEQTGTSMAVTLVNPSEQNQQVVDVYCDDVSQQSDGGKSDADKT